MQPAHVSVPSFCLRSVAMSAYQLGNAQGAWGRRECPPRPSTLCSVLRWLESFSGISTSMSSPSHPVHMQAATKGVSSPPKHRVSVQGAAVARVFLRHVHAGLLPVPEHHRPGLGAGGPRSCPGRLLLPHSAAHVLRRLLLRRPPGASHTRGARRAHTGSRECTGSDTLRGHYNHAGPATAYLYVARPRPFLPFLHLPPTAATALSRRPSCARFIF